MRGKKGPTGRKRVEREVEKKIAMWIKEDQINIVSLTCNTIMTGQLTSDAL